VKSPAVMQLLLQLPSECSDCRQALSEGHRNTQVQNKEAEKKSS
jgi:hypothetical protein